MKILTSPRVWRVLLVAGIVLAGCSGGSRSSTATQPGATKVPAAALAAAPTAEAVTVALDNGGVTAADPTLVPTVSAGLPATAVVTAASSTAVPPTTAPEPTVTAEPSAPAEPTMMPAAPAATLTSTAVRPTPAPAATDIARAASARPDATGTPTVTVRAISKEPYSLQIEVMRQQTYPGSEITFEQTLDAGVNYKRYVVSYQSEGNKIYALMTVPNGQKPATGWPVIIFNHGYIPPVQYRTTERYVAYVDGFARNGYIVFKSDYRGHGSSEGSFLDGGYGYPGYTTDVLNGMASVQAYKDADPNRIGMWGHSMGGSVTLRAMVISKDIKAGVIWGGVVAPYPDIFARGNNPLRPTQAPRTPPPGSREIGQYGRNWRLELTNKYGTPEQNPQFWASVSPNSYLADLSGPLQLHHSITDEEVPVAASQKLAEEMKALGKPINLFTYPGDNHNINANFATAMQRSIAFFDKYVKGS
jgi:uncharacterized protein